MEFRKMRRIKQQLSEAEAQEMLYNGKTGILAVNGEGGYPYTVPLNYVYADGAVYFHGARAGHRYDAVQKDDKASFCVIDKDDVVEAELTTYFRSVVAFGRVSIVSEAEELYNALYKLGMKYCPDTKRVEKEIEKETMVCCYKLTVEHMTGKEAIELVRARR